MNKNRHISNQAELEQLIERYFDGKTTVQEEQMLRETLADCPWRSEVIDEARFTMGFFAAHCQEKARTARKNHRRQLIGIAASIAIILAIGLPALYHNWLAPQPQCIAYVNGKVVANSQKAVMSLIAQDLNTMDMATREMDNAIAADINDMGDATRMMTDELSSLGEAIELDD
jgi:anti-sigma-K factor RskA